MKKYNFYERDPSISWSFCHIKSLINLSKNHQCSSFVLYAALESRNVIEKVEFEILEMIASYSSNEDFIEIIKKKNGIQKTNSNYKVLKYRYQTFSEAFTIALIDTISIKPFDLKKAEEIQNNLSQYIHIYTRTPEELIFNSSFIQEGISLIINSITNLEKSFEIKDNNYVLGTIIFDSLSGGIKSEFLRWLDSKDEDTDALTKRLIEININENQGQKIK